MRLHERLMRISGIAFFFITTSASAAEAQTTIPRGSSEREIEIGGTRLEVFTYKPQNYTNGPLLLVFHGVLRNADTYRDNAIELADRIGAVVAAPLFDKERFSNLQYQQGGLFTKSGEVADADKWTWAFVPKLVAEIRRAEGRPDLPYYLIGHSGGGQFLIRFAGFMPTEAKRIVVANAGTHLFPTTDAEYPLGFGKVPEKLSDANALRRYLAQPLTIYLGTADTEQDENLDVSPESNRQGACRYERGRNNFCAAQQLARCNGWEFRWTLVEAPGIEHDSKKMFGHPNCVQALFGTDK